MSGKSNQVLGILSAMNSILQEAIRIVSRDDEDNENLEKLIQTINTRDKDLVKWRADWDARFEGSLAKRDVLLTKVRALSKELKDLKKTPPPPVQKKKVVKPKPEPDKITLPWIGHGNQRKRARVLLDLLQTWETTSDLSSLCECTSYKVRTVLNRLMIEGKVVKRRLPGVSRKLERWQYRVKVPNVKGNVHYNYKED